MAKHINDFEEVERLLKSNHAFMVDYAPTDIMGKSISWIQIGFLSQVFTNHKITKHETTNRTTITFELV